MTIILRKSNSYNVLGVFLNRKKINNSHALAKLLIEKFVLIEKNGWQKITKETLKERRILSEKDMFQSWRLTMLEKDILICQASSEELKNNIPCYKANLFKPGPLILKHIQKAIYEFMPGKLEQISNKFERVDYQLEQIDEKFEEIDNRFTNHDERMMNLESEIQGLTNLLLQMNPPNTEARRNIVKGNFMDTERCIQLLKTPNPANDDEIN